MANLQFRDVVKKYTPTDQALGVPGGEVGGIPVPSPEDFATAEQGAKADTAVQPDDLGAAATMSPVEVVTDPDAQAALSGAFATLNAGREGTGMPEGVVSAPVGTVYRDLAATNGAVVWVKATGTGNTGWQVVWGDTGWRAITTWDTAGVVTGTALESGAPREGQAGGFWVRRVAQEVHVALRGFTVGAGPVYTSFPTGFRMGKDAVPVHRSYGHVPIYSGVVGYMGFTAAPSALSIGPVGAQINLAKARWLSDEAWPTTLPGTAA